MLWGHASLWIFPETPLGGWAVRTQNASPRPIPRPLHTCPLEDGCAQKPFPGCGGAGEGSASGRLLGLGSCRAGTSCGPWKLLAGRQLSLEFVDNDSLSTRPSSVCVLSICLCTCLHLYKAVCPGLPRRLSSQVGSAGSSCPFHHLRARTM